MSGDDGDAGGDREREEPSGRERAASSDRERNEPADREGEEPTDRERDDRSGVDERERDVPPGERDRTHRARDRDEATDGDRTWTPRVRRRDRAASGVPAAGWALGDRFAWSEIHQRLLAAADEEIDNSVRELFFSGFTAGFAIVLTFMGYAVGNATFPDNRFLGALLYPLGFMYIILGRYELFTENTLPPVKLVLTRLASLPMLLRMWTVVLIANMVGAGVGAFVLANTGVLPPGAAAAGGEFAEHGLETDWWDLFFKAVFAGWLVAGVVWLGTAARDTISRVIVVYVVFYSIPVLGLFHVISSGAEAMFFVFRGGAPGVLAVAYEFWLPVLLGNTVGGVVLVALASYGQAEQRRFPEIRVLSTRELLFSFEGGRPFETPRPGTGPAEVGGEADSELREDEDGGDSADGDGGRSREGERRE